MNYKYQNAILSSKKDHDINVKAQSETGNNYVNIRIWNIKNERRDKITNWENKNRKIS